MPTIPIGTVTAVAPDANAISRTATVVPFVDTSTLDLVGVITDAAPDLLAAFKVALNARLQGGARSEMPG